MPTGYGRDYIDCRFKGVNIYNNAASGMIWIENQISLGSNETVMIKSRFKQCTWEKSVMEVYHYHGENGIFTVDEYCKDCDDKKKTQNFQEALTSIIMRKQNVQSKL